MLMHTRKLQHAVSILSIDSTSTNNENGEDMLLPLPIPGNLTECNDELTKQQAKIEAANNELSILSQNVKLHRRKKEPLMKIKDVLQNEIANSNEIINIKSEEVTQLKNKLRHHSEKQIQNNIERLEYQLRINNYKPKEEQKILDEISMLQRSSKTLKEYNLKELENKKYRSERNRLIEQRNEIYSNIHEVYGREENEKRQINKIRRKVAGITKFVTHLLNCQTEFEHAKLEEKRQRDAIVKKKIEEKAQTKKDHYLKRQEERRKLWDEYEASREPYEEEKARCKVLISYMEKLLPRVDKLMSPNEEDGTDLPKICSTRSKNAPTQTTVEQVLNDVKSSPLLHKLDGTFYSKQKDEDSTTTRRLSKKEKARAKKELKPSKSKTLSHPPEVLADLLKLNLPIPKTTDNVLYVINSLKSFLNSYYQSNEPTILEAISSNTDQSPSFTTSVNAVDKNNKRSKSPDKSSDFVQISSACSGDEVPAVVAYICESSNETNVIATAVTKVVMTESNYLESSINSMTSSTAEVAI